MIDLLKEINEYKISVDEAWDSIDYAIEKYDRGEVDSIPQALGLDNYEWTAYAHGIHLKTLANWRRDGWPTKCGNCSKQINYKNYGWMIKNEKLVCIDCEE